MAETIIPFRSPSPQPTSSQPTRRALLAGAAVAPALALPAVALAASEADPHANWLAEARRLRSLSKNDGLTAAESDALSDRALALEDRVCLTEARTLAGACEQIAYAAAFFREYHLDVPEVVALENALATIARSTGEARHG
jgi:hypothetical protein